MSSRYVSREVSLMLHVLEQQKKQVSPSGVMSAGSLSSTSEGEYSSLFLVPSPPPAIVRGISAPSSGDSTHHAQEDMPKGGQGHKGGESTGGGNATDIILQSSLLANEVREIYHALRDKATLSMTVNETNLINIPLMGHTVHSSSLRPHKSLLLCCEPEELKDILGEHVLGKHHHATTSTDSSEHVVVQPRAQPGLKERAVAMEAIDGPILGGGAAEIRRGQAVDTCHLGAAARVSFMQRGYNPQRVLETMGQCSPTETFAELCVSLECTLSELYANVTTIVELELGRIIDTVSSNSLYQVRADAPLSSCTTAGSSSDDPLVARAFASSFAGADLLFVLSLFDGRRTLLEVIPLLPAGLTEYGVDVVVWLLRWNMLQPLQVYLVNNPMRSEGPTLASRNIRLTTAKNRIKPALNGQVCLREIMWVYGDCVSEEDIDALIREGEVVAHVRADCGG